MKAIWWEIKTKLKLEKSFCTKDKLQKKNTENVNCVQFLVFFWSILTFDNQFCGCFNLSDSVSHATCEDTGVFFVGVCDDQTDAVSFGQHLERVTELGVVRIVVKKLFRNKALMAFDFWDFKYFSFRNLTDYNFHCKQSKKLWALKLQSDFCCESKKKAWNLFWRL